MSPSRAVGGIGLAVIFAWAGAAASLLPGTAVLEGRMAGSPRHHRVDVRDLVFQPSELEVAPGDTVTWINHDIVPHTVTAAGAGWDSGELSFGEKFTWVVEGSGEVRYLCRYHPTMTGTLKAR